MQEVKEKAQAKQTEETMALEEELAALQARLDLLLHSLESHDEDVKKEKINADYAIKEATQKVESLKQQEKEY